VKISLKCRMSGFEHLWKLSFLLIFLRIAYNPITVVSVVEDNNRQNVTLKYLLFDRSCTKFRGKRTSM